MPNAAVPNYLGTDFSEASPGMRFGMYLKLWEGQAWSKIKGKPLDSAKRLTNNDQETMHKLLARQKLTFDTMPSAAALCLEASATAPFTTGLGNEHPLESGFAFLNPYGLPYLPGSGVKGVLRQAARELASGDWGDAHGWNEDKCYTLMHGEGEQRHTVLDKNKQPVMLSMLDVFFGRESDNGDTDHLRGALVFWDVIPQIAGESLTVEIMTPHQSHYYQWKKDQRGNEIPVPPHDSGQPTPISFLTVPPKSGFVFHVQCNLAHLNRLSPDLAVDGKWRGLLTAAFEHAFDWLGFGAKTAVGYGAMTRLSDEDIAAARSAAEQEELKCAWVDETITRFINEMPKKANNEKEALRGKALAEAWVSLTDADLKQRALNDIRSRWHREGWWDTPPKGAAMKAKVVYEGEE